MRLNFAGNITGNFATILAIVAPVILGSAGGMIDYHVYRSNVTTLQNAADTAALGATREAMLEGWKTNIAQAVAENFVEANLSSAGLTKGKYKVTVSVNETEQRVKVDVLQTEFSYMMIGFFKQTPFITASATAQAIGDSNICVVGIMQPQAGRISSPIHLDDYSRIDSPECGIYADSRDPEAFRVDRGAYVRANTVCSAGGFYTGFSRGNYTIQPSPRVDCPLIGDPLALRPPPPVAACDYTNLVVTAATSLTPGVYCGGLEIDGDFKVTLKPGIFTIKDGPLKVTGTVSFVGQNVGIHLTGHGSVFHFDRDTEVNLEAPVDGPMAGLLFYEDRDVPHDFSFNYHTYASTSANFRMHKMSSNNARNLVGTFYLPRSVFSIDANAAVADKSAYTAIVTGRLWLQQGPTLVLNADYTASVVPVPDGLGPKQSGVKLVR